MATEYIDPDPTAASKLQQELCADPATSDATANYGGTVYLGKPLKGRTAVDGTSHTTFQVLDASVVPSISGLPSAFHDQGYYGRAEQKLVGRSWANQRVQITLDLEPIDSNVWSTGDPSTIGLVNGHPTEFLDLDRHTIAWQNGAHVYVIQEIPLNGTLDYEFTPQQLLELARSVR